MKTEQIIYTSCRQGIHGQSSGFQVYSYSPRMGQWVDNRDGIGVLEQYKAPTGPQYPMLPTPEQLEELYPRRNYCGPLPGPDGLYGMALCSYIGRDYPEGSIRGGNFIAHGTALPVPEMLGTHTYPCEYLDSPSYLRTMDVEKARSEERPATLGQLDLEPNDAITLDAVRDFLEDEDRDDLFKLMLACFLTRQDGGALRRIIIRDSAENFNLWVAALQMALPVRQALTYPFSTYEYDPLATDAHVVRAVDGMNADLASLAMTSQVFDENNEVPLPRSADDGPVSQACDFIVDAMMVAPDSLRAFHDFLDATDYTGTDTGIADAHLLFQLSTGMADFHEMDVAEAQRALAFMRGHCSADVARTVAARLFDDVRDNLLDDAHRTLARDVLAHVAGADGSYAPTAREAALDLLFSVFTDATPRQDMYEQFHDIAQAVFQAIGQNVDVVLFDELTGNPSVSLGLDGTPGTALPWTVDAYARWTAQTLLNDPALAGIRPGMSAQRMRASLAPRSTNALDKIVRVIVSHPDAAGGVRLAQEFAGTLSTDGRLACMIDLLIILEGDPQAMGASGHSVKDSVAMAYRAFHSLYAQQDPDMKVASLQACCASGLELLAMGLLVEQGRNSQTDPEGYLQFLVRTVPQLPGGFAQAHASEIAGVCEGAIGPAPSPLALCKCMDAVCHMVPMGYAWYQDKVDRAADGIRVIGTGDADDAACREVRRLCGAIGQGVHLPGRVVLVEHQLVLGQLSAETGQRHPDQAKLSSCVRYLTRQGPTLPLETAKAQANDFVIQVADQIAKAVLTMPTGRDLLVCSVPAERVMDVIRRVLEDVIGWGRMDDILLMLALDAQIMTDSTLHGTVPYVEERNLGVLAAFAASRMCAERIKSADVRKIVDDRKRLDRHVAGAFRDTYRLNFPQQPFDALADMIVRNMEQREATAPKGIGGMADAILGRIKLPWQR